MSWIRYALNHKPKILQILSIRKLACSFDVTNDLFACASLEELYLDLGEDIVLDNVFLPKLRKARFSRLSMNQDSIEKFLSGCPALESIDLMSCELNANRILFHTVKQLNLYYCRLMSQLDPTSFSIFAPELEYLKFVECGVSIVKFKDMSKVKKARITSTNGNNILAYNSEYLSSFSCVVDLVLDSWYFLKETLEKELPSCLTFRNLKKLVLGTGCIHCGDFDVLPSFLKHCPNLEFLMLLHKDDDCRECDMHNDFDAHELVRLLVKSTNGMDQVQIKLA